MKNLLLPFVERCNQNLLNSSNDECANAMKYLLQRHIKVETIQDLKIGYCMSNERDMSEVRKYCNGDYNQVDGEKDYSYFIKGRIIVPVFAEFGEAVGFATRKPTFEKGNTWWNLPKPFKKGQYLYLLDKTRKDIFDTNKVYLVEGYVDAILLYQEGIRNVCSIMGTALTSRKIGLIVRYCNSICLCFDSDENNSGQKAQEKSVFLLNEFGYGDFLSVINLPVGVDPDEYVVKYGPKDLLNQEKQLSRTEVINICEKWKKNE